MSEYDETIDWKAIWRELDWDASEDEADTSKRRLQQRARQYASLLPDDSDNATSRRTMLGFRLGEENYAIDVTLVQSVRPIEHITPVPATPLFYRGVVNVRGQVISVIDLRLFFDMNTDAEDIPREMMIIRTNGLEIGLLAHQVHDVMNIPEATIEPIDDMKYGLGMTRDRTMLLDIAALFEDDRLIIGATDE